MLVNQSADSIFIGDWSWRHVGSREWGIVFNSSTVRLRATLIPDTESACKNSTSSQISSFCDNYRFFHFIYKIIGTNRQADPWWAGIFSTHRLLRFVDGQVSWMEDIVLEIVTILLGIEVSIWCVVDLLSISERWMIRLSYSSLRMYPCF